MLLCLADKFSAQLPLVKKTRTTQQVYLVKIMLKKVANLKPIQHHKPSQITVGSHFNYVAICRISSEASQSLRRSQAKGRDARASIWYHASKTFRVASSSRRYPI